MEGDRWIEGQREEAQPGADPRQGSNSSSVFCVCVYAEFT
jgi:hypothetical protein